MLVRECESGSAEGLLEEFAEGAAELVKEAGMTEEPMERSEGAAVIKLPGTCNVEPPGIADAVEARRLAPMPPTWIEPPTGKLVDDGRLELAIEPAAEV